MELLQLTLLAFLGEALWETLKMTWKEGKPNINRIGALVIGVSIAIFTNSNIFEMLGFNVKYKLIGQICTGLIISRGANFVHDFVGMIRTTYESRKTI